MNTMTVDNIVRTLPVSIWRFSSLRDFWVMFRNLTNTHADAIIKVFSKKSEKTEIDPLIRCKNCQNIITTIDKIISIAGQHQHTFRNPAGIVYSIGCFSKARGCFDLGELTPEFTWFPGFSWCYSICSKCYNHIGWFYSSGDSTFYGLILNRLEGGR